RRRAALTVLLVEEVKAGDGGAGYRHVTNVDRPGGRIAPTAVATDVEARVASLTERSSLDPGHGCLRSVPALAGRGSAGHLGGRWPSGPPRPAVAQRATSAGDGPAGHLGRPWPSGPPRRSGQDLGLLPFELLG